ncbi:MAG: transcription antitermination factor NusB [Clostridia bacterium]|nr:transcription antitermination factor NusB [Clostridia bacterium]MBQ3041863.1 transcription antitermination factor NusB [Clostridia bacterium]MBQ4272149.1 transcription antitermination factor NusB [Clostridia bacterium]
MRGYAREVAFCKIYTYIMSESFEPEFSQFDSSKLTEEDLAFATKIVEGVIEHKEEIDGIIAELSKSFKLSRIYRLDLAILELAIFEMKYMDTPHPVVINECVTIIKDYSTEKSVNFVNGILAQFERSTN